ncbi:hemerythrin HHE cation binding domain-containing protein [Frankia sp. EI5c]|uniref:hemerythrin domain-containing protein n=1 Tax=Frankia sp. EI5c TaxID=683316 RepID=UPI0007C33BAD|nr:hemerythrin domain-containing protein [Frankia sp. EI5c]OAA25642.1 hemerythrin HHE cation binding domain-containing protein [Frankia sp. EI5c]
MAHAHVTSHADEAVHPNAVTGPGGASPRGAESTARSGEPGGADSLVGLVSAAHRDAAELLELAERELRDRAGRCGDPSADPRLTLHASDAAVAAISAHLSVMEGVVYPEAAAVLPRGRARTAALRETSHRAALLMRGLQQYVQGDRYQPERGPGELCDELAEFAAAHARAEERLLADLEERLGGPRARRLQADFERAMRRAPTRPHPHLGHGTSLPTRLAARLAGHWDHLLDTVDARAVAGRPVRAPAPAGLWGWYLLGRPTEDHSPAEASPAEARSTAEGRSTADARSTAEGRSRDG